MKPYYEHAGITIYHGDCREVLPTVAADVAITDPPYNVGLEYCNGDKRTDYREWSEEWFRICIRPLVFTPGLANLGLWLSIEHPRWVCAWVKPNQNSPSALNGFNAWEPVLVYGKHRKPVGQDIWISNIAMQTGVGDHPCPKHLPSWRKIVESFATPSDVIVDPFCGSGTTLRVAKDTARRAIGIEIEERYCEIAAKRLSQEVLPL